MPGNLDDLYLAGITIAASALEDLPGKRPYSLTRDAHNIQIFNDGEEIMDYLIKVESIECPDIILLDINMPMMDGWDFLEEYEKHLGGSESKIKIYMLRSTEGPINDGQSNIQHKEVASAKHLVPNVSVD